MSHFLVLSPSFTSNHETNTFSLDEETLELMTIDASKVFVQLVQGLLVNNLMRSQTDVDFQDSLLYLRSAFKSPVDWKLRQVEQTIFWKGYTQIVKKQWTLSTQLSLSDEKALEVFKSIVPLQRFQDALAEADGYYTDYFHTPTAMRDKLLNSRIDSSAVAKIRAVEWMSFFNEYSPRNMSNGVGSPITEKKKILQTRSAQLQSDEHHYGYTPHCIELLASCNTDQERREALDNITKMSRLFKSVKKIPISAGGLEELSRENGAMKEYTQTVYSKLSVEKPLDQAIVSPRFQKDVETCDRILPKTNTFAKVKRAPVWKGQPSLARWGVQVLDIGPKPVKRSKGTPEL